MTEMDDAKNEVEFHAWEGICIQHADKPIKSKEVTSTLVLKMKFT